MPLNFKNPKTIAIAAFSGLFAITSASVAQAGDHVPFAYKASELESTGGVSGLYARIESRAENVCASDPRALYARKASAACKADLIEDWVSEIDDTRLHRHHAQNGAQQIASVN